jgi:hypothetical protein
MDGVMSLEKIANGDSQLLLPFYELDSRVRAILTGERRTYDT